MSLSKQDILQVKARGFLRNRGTDRFSGRVVSVGGIYSADALCAIAECAERFGSGDVIFTSRLSAEIVGIPFEKITEAEQFLQARGLSFGGTGAKIRPITACKGTTCVFGNINTRAIAEALHKTFYVDMADVSLPHKFKIGVGGCPNSCMKPSLNDVGIEGHRAARFDREKCRGCRVCAVSTACPSGAIRVVDGKADVDTARCRNCGVCAGKCPFDAFADHSDGYCIITVGGTWGKIRRDGTPLSRPVPTDEVIPTVEKILLWYRENGYVKERLGATVDRVGMDKLEAAVFGNDLIRRREAILAAPLLTRPEAK